ncbi:hypothetical protein TRVA0_002S05160 [Trichomonascus vanleenenianus]|uniref:uncharacterized protein n=1 Tax=Trichomonascus vanleenenianus TaxID=2268995 RepID=UPI003EC97649
MKFSTSFYVLLATALAAQAAPGISSSSEVTIDARANRGPLFAFVDGAREGVNNAQQHVDSVVNAYRNNPDRAGAAAATALLTGLDSQIDTAIATVSNALAPFTFGVSKAIGNVLLGPFVQSVTDGLEVMLGNAVGGVIDMARPGAFQQNLSRLIAQSKEYNINVSKLQTLQAQLQNTLPHKRDEVEIDARANRGPLFAFVDGAREGVNNAQQHVDSVVNAYRNNPDRAGAAAATAMLTGLDSQIDTAIATVSNALAPFTFGVSKAIGNVLLGPFVQSVTDGLEVMLGNAVGGVIDMARPGAFQRNLSRLIAQSKEYNINVSKLETLQAQMTNTLPKGN